MPSTMQSRCLSCLLLLLVALALLAGPPAEAGLSWQDEDGVRPAPALLTEFDTEVRGLLVETRLTQHFINHSEQWLEGRYTAALPADAAVHGLTLRIGERLIEGEVRLREQARIEYEAAKLEGRRSALVENQQGNLFRTRVAHVGPGEVVEVSLRFSHLVRFEHGRFVLNLPLSLVSRYGSAPALDGIFSGIEDAAEPGAAATATVRLLIDPGIEIEPPYSDSHVLQRREHALGFELSSGAQPMTADRDLVVQWLPKAGKAPSAALFTEAVGDEQYGLLMVVPPTQPGPRLPRELILIVDTSGSMQGVSLHAAKAAAKLALGGLDPTDRFNLIRFSSDHQLLFERSSAPTPDNLAQALAFIERFSANGGTEMTPALNAAFTLPTDADRVRQVVFVTDGAVSHEDRISAQVGKQAGQARLFAVGIGPAPNAHFLRKAAELGRGSALMVRDPGEAQTRMGELLQQLDSPLLTRLSVHSEVPVQTLPAVLPDLYAGQPLLLMLRGDQLTGKLRVEGLSQGASWQREFALSKRNDQGVGRLYGRRLIDSLEDQLRLSGETPELRAQMETTALAFGLASRYTSFVAVERSPSRAADSALRKVAFANAPPAGADGFAQTALGWKMGMLIALLLSAMALLLRWRS